MAGYYRIEFENTATGEGIFSLHGPNGFFIDDGTGRQANLYLTIYNEMPEPADWNDLIRPSLNGIVNWGFGTLYDAYEYTEGWGASNEAIFLKQYLTYAEGEAPSESNGMSVLFQLIKNIQDTDGYSDPEWQWVAEELPLTMTSAVVEEEPMVPTIIISDGALLSQDGFAVTFGEEGIVTPPVEGLSVDEVAYFNYGTLFDIANAGSKFYLGHNMADINDAGGDNGGFAQCSSFDIPSELFLQLGDGLNNDVFYVSYNETTNKVLLVGGFDMINNGHTADASSGAIVWNVTTSDFEALTSIPANFSGAGAQYGSDCNKYGIFGTWLIDYNTFLQEVAVIKWDGNNTLSVVCGTLPGNNTIMDVSYDEINEKYYVLVFDDNESQTIIKTWNGSSWDDVFSADSAGGYMYNITIHNGILYVAGDVMMAGGTNHYDNSHIFGYAGLLKIDLINETMEKWGEFSGDRFFNEGSSYSTALAVNPNDGKIYMGGYFSAVDYQGSTTTFDGLLRYDPTNDVWEAFEGTGFLEWGEPNGFAFDGANVYTYGYLAGVNGEYFDRYNYLGGEDMMLIRFNNVV